MPVINARGVDMVEIGTTWSEERIELKSFVRQGPDG
jgi:hypothetical protein